MGGSRRIAHARAFEHFELGRGLESNLSAGASRAGWPAHVAKQARVFDRGSRKRVLEAYLDSAAAAGRWALPEGTHAPRSWSLDPARPSGGPWTPPRRWAVGRRAATLRHVPRCDHAAFRVADLDRTIAFYTRLLPARLVSRRAHRDRWRTEIAALRPEGQPEFTLVFLMPRRVRWFLRCAHALVPRQTRSHEHLGFVCESRAELEAIEHRAREMDARVENPLTRLDGRDVWILEVLDPDGNAIEWTSGPVHGP